MSANLSSLVSELVGPARDLVAAAGAAGLLPRVTSALRSRAEQTRLYRRALQGLSGYPVAPPGHSAHEYGWAFDLVVSPFYAIRDVGLTWRDWGGAWFESDLVHFELPGAAAAADQLGLQADSEKGWTWNDVLSIFYPMHGVDMPVAAEKAKIESEADKFLKAYGI